MGRGSGCCGSWVGVLLVSLWVGVLGCGDTPVNVVSLLVSFVGRGARLWRHPG